MSRRLFGRLTKYRAMEFFDRFGLLRFVYALYLSAQVLNPVVWTRNVRFWFRGAPDGIPMPSARLVSLVAGTSDLRWFWQGGKLAAESIESVLKKNEADLDSFNEILDFGCGCGRVIRHLKINSSLHGTDYNPDLINWCRSNLPFGQFDTNGLAPPTRYPYEKFDFIYALSVLTHLPEELQGSWMKELWRVLRPGGYLIISTHGESYLARLDQAEQRQFMAGRLVVKRSDYAGANICTVFHPEQYVRRELAGSFVVIDFIAQGAHGNPHQDLFLMRKMGGRAHITQ